MWAETDVMFFLSPSGFSCVTLIEGKEKKKKSVSDESLIPIDQKWVKEMTQKYLVVGLHWLSLSSLLRQPSIQDTRHVNTWTFLLGINGVIKTGLFSFLYYMLRGKKTLSKTFIKKRKNLSEIKSFQSLHRQGSNAGPFRLFSTNSLGYIKFLENL